MVEKKTRQTWFTDRFTGKPKKGFVVSAESEPPGPPPEFYELSEEPPKFVIVPANKPLSLHKPKDINIIIRDD